jgi:uncharacterized protein YerC
MTQVSKYPLGSTISKRIMDIFVKTLINVKNETEAKELIFDFLTPTERIVQSKRLAIALLLEKEYDYRTIGDILKVSSATIAHVNNARKNASSGYIKFMKKIIADEKITKFLDQTLVSVMSVPASVKGGTSFWKELNNTVINRQKKNAKPF